MRSIIFDETSMAVNRGLLHTIPMPEATDSYQPVRHNDLVDLVEDKLQPYGLRFGEQQHVLAREGQRYFGMFELLNGVTDPDHGLVLGLRNSYDKSAAATILLGNQVFICANMSYGAAHVIGRKHTINILNDLPELIDVEVQKIHVYAEVQRQRFARYQGWRLHDMTADHLMVTMLRQGAINSTRFPKLVQEWHEPSEDHGSKTVWRLFNAATRALKGMNPMAIPQHTMKLQAIADNAVGWREAA